MRYWEFLLLMFFVLAGGISASFVFAAKNGDVLINEIAWMGTEVSYNDEWIELRNNSGLEINLEGWVLKAADGSPKINTAGMVPAGGFYLLERSKNYTGALENGGEVLELYDNLGNLINRVDASAGWPAGDNTTKKTMERTVSGWQTSASAGGTPMAENSKVADVGSPPVSPPMSESGSTTTAEFAETGSPQTLVAAGQSLNLAQGKSFDLAQDKQASKSLYVFLAAFALAFFSGTAIFFLKRN